MFFCVQVTFGRMHDKTVLAYKKLFLRLGLKEADKVDIYVLCCKQDADEYAKFNFLNQDQKITNLHLTT